MSTKLEKRPGKSVPRPPKPRAGLSKAVVDRGIAEGLEDIRKGRVKGPYSDGDSFLKALHDDVT